MKVQVSLTSGTVEEALEALSCHRCSGNGKRQTAYNSGIFEVCDRCDGDGLDPHPSKVYVYEVDEPVEVGDRVQVPPNAYYPSSVGIVVRLGSDYDGSIRRAVKVAT